MESQKRIKKSEKEKYNKLGMMKRSKEIRE